MRAQMAEDRNVVNLLIGRFADLDAAVAARVILFVSSFLSRRLKWISRWMNSANNCAMRGMSLSKG